MAKEPYVSSAVYDMTGGLQPAPADDGYNIAMWVSTPCGPTTKTKVLSQKDFIDKYMTGTTITPNDHMSAIMAYMTLAQNPLYLVRACPVTYLEGISCTGNSYLFDKSFKPLDSYNRFKIESVSVPAGDYEVGKDGGTKLSSNVSIDALVKSIMEGLETREAAALAMEPISAKDYSISSHAPLAFSNNIAVKASQIRYGEYSNIALSTDDETLPEGAALNVGDSTAYYFGKGENTGIYANGIAITYGHQGSNIDAKLFLHLVAKKSGVIENIIDTTKLVLKDGEDTLTQTGALANLNIVNYSDKPALPTKNDGVFEDALKFSGSGSNLAFITDVPVAAVSQNTICVNNGEITYYLNGDDTACYTVASTSVCEVKKSDDTLCYVFVADAPTSTDSASMQQIFCITIGQNNTCSQLSGVCSSWDDLLDFFIYQWAGVAANFDVAITGGTISLWSKTTAPFASVNSVLNSGITTDGDSVATYHYTLATDTENASVLEHDFLWVQVNDVLYYSGTFPVGFVVGASTQVQLTPQKCNSIEFLSLLEGALYLNQQIGSFKDYFVTTNEITVTCKENIVCSGVENIDQTGRTEQFAIVQAFPTTESLFKYSYELDEDSVDASGSIYNLHLDYKNGEVKENWTISFNPGKVDGYGVDQWYNRVQSDYFKIVSFTEEGVLREIEDSFTSQAWGKGISVPDYNVQYAISAMQSIPEYEDGVSYHVLSDAGVANTSLASAIEALAEQMHSVYLASLPEAELNINSLIAYVGGADLKSYQTRMLAAGDRININGFSKILPGSYKLILQYISMFRNKAAEFAPNFGLAHGVVGVSNLVQDFTKPEREKLLDYHIESLKGGVVTEYYINRNDTAQKAKSYMSEDQNVRMTNIAVHLCEDNLKQYIGELNTAVLRDLVQTRLTTAIQDRLFKGKTYAPAMYRVVCDDSNNPLSVIEQNQLVVSLYASFTPSIQYVLVDHFIVPLSQVQ